MSKAKLGRMAWDALKGMVWQKGAGQAQNLTNLGIRVLPEVGFAAASGTFMAPEGTTMGERFAMAGEDLALGLGTSLIGGGAGRGIAAKTAKKGLGAEALRNRIDMGQNFGDVLGGMSLMALPRPITQGVYEATAERANASNQQMAAAQQQLFEQEMLAAAALSAGVPLAAIGAQGAAPWVRSALGMTS